MLLLESIALLGLTAEGWTAVWTALLTLVTLLLVIVGFVQLRALREESRLQRTLNECNKYQVDPIMDACLRRVAEAWVNGDIYKNTIGFRPDITTILNYLDSLAAGCEQGIYLEDFVLRHMRPIYEYHYMQYMGPSPRVVVAGLDVREYIGIERAIQKWSQRPWYRRV